MTKPTPSNVTERLCELLAKPMHAKHACAGAGLGYSTYFRWLQWGAEDFDPKGWTDDSNPPPDDLDPYQAFAAAVDVAKADGIGVLTETVLDSVKGRRRARYSQNGALLEEWIEYDTGAALKLMAALAPEEYGNRQKIEHAGHDGGQLEVIHRASRNLDSRVAQLAARIREGAGDPDAGADAG